MLQKLRFLPGINKQVSSSGGEGQWVDGDNVRFRYGKPEKMGGWAQLGGTKITGRNTSLHHFVTKDGIKYAALGTNRILYVYSGGVFYDVHPIKTTTTLSNAFSTTNGSSAVTITFASNHNITNIGDIILLDNFSSITNSNFSASDFNDVKFAVTSIPSATTITITMPSNESGSGATTSGGVRVQHYYPVGLALETAATGWGLGQWGGIAYGQFTSTLSSSLNSSATSLTMASSVSFSSSGTVLIDDELITYTANDDSGTLSGLTRGAQGTTAASHNSGATVTDASNYSGWNSAPSGDIVNPPGMWSLDNFGSKLIATINGGETFSWDSEGSTSTRAALLSNAPTASAFTLVSTPDRHLVLFGTETTIGTQSTQDEMFIRFSDQESIDAST